jgi:hypothetical protein
MSPARWLDGGTAAASARELAVVDDCRRGGQGGAAILVNSERLASRANRCGQRRHLVLARGGYAVSEVAKGSRQRRFFALGSRQARHSEADGSGCRAGLPPGCTARCRAGRQVILSRDLWEWRYRRSLDLSPWVDSPTTTTSLDRLDAECGEQLRGLGLSKIDGDDRWWRRSVWTDRWWRPVWTGYTPEQSRSSGTGVRLRCCVRRNSYEPACHGYPHPVFLTRPYCPLPAPTPVGGRFLAPQQSPRVYGLRPLIDTPGAHPQNWDHRDTGTHTTASGNKRYGM